jgi:hypothetical protein
MKYIITLLLSFTLCNILLAQKTITFNGKNIEVEGTLVATHIFVSNGKDDGTKEIYSYRDADMNILTITELNTDKDNKLSSVFIYLVNLNKIDKNRCYVITKNNISYKQPEVYVAMLGLQTGFNINVKSMNWGASEWTRSNDPVAQIYFTNNADAEKYVEEMKK